MTRLQPENARDETIPLRKAPWEYYTPMRTKDDEASSTNFRKMFGWGTSSRVHPAGLTDKYWWVLWELSYTPLWTANFWNWPIVVSSKLFVVLIHRRSTQAFPGTTREVPANKDNVRNLRKTEHLKSTQYFVGWIITSDENCLSFKSHKAGTHVDKNRSHKITARFGSKYLHWWTVGKKFSRILRRVEYFLSRMWRRWRWLRRSKRQVSSSVFCGQTLTMLNFKKLD